MSLTQNIRRTRPIFLRMAIVLVIAPVLLIIATGFWIEGEVRQIVTRDREAAAMAIATAAAFRLAPLFAAEDYEGIAISLRGVIERTATMDVLVADASGRVLARVIRGGSGSAADHPIEEVALGGVVAIPEHGAVVRLVNQQLHAWAQVDAGDDAVWVRAAIPSGPLLTDLERLQRSTFVLLGIAGTGLFLMLAVPLGRVLRQVDRRECDLLAEQQELREAIYHDRLTGLWNRVGLAERLGRALAARRAGEQLIAVCFLDLDGFKAVNDRFGHAVGDLLLVEVARRLSASVRDTDTVARLGGDEFVVVLEGESRSGELHTLLESIVARVSKQVPAGGRPLRVGVSVGVTVRHSAADTVESLLKEADEAMYEAKRAGRNRWVLHGSVSGALFRRCWLRPAFERLPA